MPADTEHTVRLDAFEGPLDLLLFLIRRAEVDIGDIPIAQITDQYLAHVGTADDVDIDLAGEFLVMAATLVEIKSRFIERQTQTPETDENDGPDREEPAADPRHELVRQLLEYKAFRDAADALEIKRETWERRVPAAPVPPSGDEFAAALEASGDLELEELNLLDLAESFRRIAESVNFDRLGEHEVASDETPIEIHAEDIVARLREQVGVGGQLPLFGLLEGRTRGEMVGLFLAMLVLIRDQRISVRAAGEGVPHGILVTLRPDSDAEAGPVD